MILEYIFNKENDFFLSFHSIYSFNESRKGIMKLIDIFPSGFLVSIPTETVPGLEGWRFLHYSSLQYKGYTSYVQ